MKIELLSEARQDLVDACFFYEKQAAGLGQYFRNTLLADIESLASNAGILRFTSVFTACYPDGFHTPFITKCPKPGCRCLRSWTAAGIPNEQDNG